MAETLSDDGMEIVKRPFKWFAGIGESDDKQIAIEIAQREAQSAVSRIIRNEVIDQATKIGVAANGRVRWSHHGSNTLIVSLSAASRLAMRKFNIIRIQEYTE